MENKYTYVNSIVRDVDIISQDFGLICVIKLESPIGEIQFGESTFISNHELFNGPAVYGNYAGYYIDRILAVFKVKKLSSIIGKSIRVMLKKSKINDYTIVGLAHILYDDIYFIPMDDFNSNPKQLDKSQSPDTDNDFIDPVEDTGDELTESPMKEDPTQSGMINIDEVYTQDEF